jgi:hypothetical protein
MFFLQEPPLKTPTGQLNFDISRILSIVCRETKSSNEPMHANILTSLTCFVSMRVLLMLMADMRAIQKA